MIYHVPQYGAWFDIQLSLSDLNDGLVPRCNAVYWHFTCILDRAALSFPVKEDSLSEPNASNPSLVSDSDC